MRCVFALLTFVACPALAQVFDVASVKRSPRPVGPDYNNKITYTPAGITARNATLRRLAAEAWRVQLNQVIGPNWLDEVEDDLDGRSDHPASAEETDLRLRALLIDRFHLQQHPESREMRVYELTTAKTGAKIHPVNEGDAADATGGFHFRGRMRQFADFLTVQFSIPAVNDPSQPSRAGGPRIPVLDKTGLSGTYDFNADIRPEPGTDSFTLWKRKLPDLGLAIESRKGPVDVIVIDSADRNPSAN